MSGLSIAAFFPFRRIKITAQQVSTEATEAHIQSEPDMRFHPICHVCDIANYGTISKKNGVTHFPPSRS